MLLQYSRLLQYYYIHTGWPAGSDSRESSKTAVSVAASGKRLNSEYSSSPAGDGRGEVVSVREHDGGPDPGDLPELGRRGGAQEATVPEEISALSVNIRGAASKLETLMNIVSTFNIKIVYIYINIMYS